MGTAPPPALSTPCVCECVCVCVYTEMHIRTYKVPRVVQVVSRNNDCPSSYIAWRTSVRLRERERERERASERERGGGWGGDRDADFDTQRVVGDGGRDLV